MEKEKGVRHCLLTRGENMVLKRGPEMDGRGDLGTWGLTHTIKQHCLCLGGLAIIRRIQAC